VYSAFLIIAKDCDTWIQAFGQKVKEIKKKKEQNTNRQKHTKNKQTKWKQITLPVNRIENAKHILKVLIRDQNTPPWSSWYIH
jgi:hypothetical protein